MLNILRFASPPPKPPEPAAVIDPLAALFAERETAFAKLGKFEVFNTRVNEAEAVRAAAKAAIFEYDRAYVSDLSAWCEGNGGEPPTKDASKLKALVDASDAAEREYESAIEARAAIEPNHSRIRTTLHAIQVKIDWCIAETCADEAVKQINELAEILNSASVLFAKIHAGKAALHQRSEEHQNSGQGERGQAYAVAAGRIANLVSPVLTIRADPNDINAHMAGWRAKLRGDC